MGPIRLRDVFLAGCALGAIASPSLAADPLADGFRDPPAAARPRVWWHWMNGNITRQGVDSDLEWMKRVGIGGFQNFDISLSTPQVVDKRLAYMTPEWKAVFRHAAERAEDLGLEMAIASSPGWSETGGPWVKPEQAMKKLVWSETHIEGGRRFTGALPSPPNVTGPFQAIPAEVGGVFGWQGDTAPPRYYADSAVIAYRTPVGHPLPKPVITTSDGSKKVGALSDGDLTTTVRLPASATKAAWIQFDYGGRQTIQTVAIATTAIPAIELGGPTAARLTASNDGVTFRPVADLPIRIAPQQTQSIAPVTARYFRIELTSPASPPSPPFDAFAPGADPKALAINLPPPSPDGPHYEIAEASLSADPAINQFELKANFGIVPDYYTLEVANRQAIKGVSPTDVVDLTSRMTADGRLDWTPPPGHWTVLRLGYSLRGIENHPATLEATGLEVDKLNKADVAAYLNTYLDTYASFLGPDLIGKHGVRAMVNDSTEVGPQNWTDSILQDFQTRRGYDPRPWLPTLTGVIVADEARSDAFLYDFRKTLAELTTDNHYKVVAEIAHARGLITYGEALEGSRPSLGDDLEMRRYTTIPMAAMWTYSAAGPRSVLKADIRGAASVAHIYGQNLVAAESMTAAMAPWAFTPKDLKKVIDLEFALGVNRPVVHTSVHQPLDRKPGLSLALFGQYFNRNDTWAEQAGPWVDYMSRNAFMLQQGRYFADVAVFSGEEAPLSGLYLEHDPEHLPHGYAFDFVNPTILNTVLTVEDGQLTAPSGARYRLLYLGGSSRRMTVPTLRRIRDLVAAGAVVAGLRPESSPGLTDDPAAFQALADQLWRPGKTITSLGKGEVITEADPDKALAVLNLAPDFNARATPTDTDVMFVHRKLADGDLYYLDNREHRPVHLDAQFRITGRAPEVWRAEDGRSEPATYRIENGVTTVPIDLGSEESVYVVFRQAATQAAREVPKPVETVLATLGGPWTVSFEPGRGAPASAKFERLASWSESQIPGIKYFSGAGAYSRDIEISAAQLQSGRRVLIDLGDVRDLAEVRVNGAPAGTVWHAPYRLDLTGKLKPGVNHLEIKVIDTWVNRLIGDKQPGATPITFTAIPTYLADAPLRPAGLIGPVQLVSQTSGR